MNSEHDTWVAGNPLRRLRLLREQTQAEAAREMNVTAQTLRQWETGGWDPSIEGLEKIGKYMNRKLGTVRAVWNEWKAMKQ